MKNLMNYIHQMMMKMMFDNETNNNYDNVINKMDLFDLNLFDLLNNRNKLFHVDHWVDHLINESLKNKNIKEN